MFIHMSFFLFFFLSYNCALTLHIMYINSKYLGAHSRNTRETAQPQSQQCDRFHLSYEKSRKSALHPWINKHICFIIYVLCSFDFMWPDGISENYLLPGTNMCLGRQPLPGSSISAGLSDSGWVRLLKLELFFLIKWLRTYRTGWDWGHSGYAIWVLYGMAWYGMVWHGPSRLTICKINNEGSLDAQYF